MLKLINKTDSLNHLISPRVDIARPIYNWHSFKHSYSKELVDNLISEFGLKQGAWVMDSFCGGGTSLLACREAGINSTGYDILPFSVFLSKVKTQNYDVSELKSEQKKFQPKKYVTMDFPSLTDIPIARKAFSPSTKDELIKIKQRIEEIKNDQIRDFYNLGLLSILESVSNTSKAGGFLRITERNVRREKVIELFDKRIDAMISDVSKFKETFKHKKVSTTVRLGDARKLNGERQYNAIITSPPYPNRHDYSRIYSLEMLFDFVDSNEELKQIRYDTLRSHVEARERHVAKGYEQPKKLTSLVRRVESNGLNNPQVIEMLTGYFEDMYLALKMMKNKLEDKGKIALVVSNVRFSGVNIPVDSLLAEIGEQVGLEAKAIWVARFRGNSAQQMRDFDRNPSRESIVIWEN